jgi:alkylation response protein AidB-like acyl-CoA dehydrogenase
MSMLLNEEQGMLRDSAREFLQAQSPVSLQRKLRDERAPLGFEPALWQQAVDLGWTAAVFPEDKGGLAFGYAGLGAVFEQCGRTLAALPLLSNVVLGGELLLAAGNAQQHERWLGGLIDGSQRFALALDEQRGRHAPHAIATVARQESGGWVLDGDKWFVIDGLGARWLIVAAQRCSSDGSDQGLGLFIVDSARPGVSITPLSLADSRNHARVQLRGVRVADDMQLAAVAAPAALDAALDRARVMLAAEAQGLLRRVFEDTIGYMKERVQFDVAIGSFQALQHRAARLFTELELLDSAVAGAIEAIDTGSPELPLLASLAKARAADLCEKLGNEAIQLHGGIGVTDEFDLGLFVKRARVIQHSLGDAFFHRNRYACLKGF